MAEIIGYSRWIEGRFRGPDKERLTAILSDGTVRPVRPAEVANVPCVAAGGREAQGLCWGVDLYAFMLGENVGFILADAKRDPTLREAIERCRQALARS